METNLLLMIIFIPLLVSLLNIFLPRIVYKALSLLTLLFNIILVFMVYFASMEAGFSSEIYKLLLFDSSILSVTYLGIFALIFIQILSGVILIFSIKGIGKEIERRFYSLYVMTVGFCNGVIVSDHIISFILFWGLSGLTLYLFSTLGETHDSPKTAKKTFIIIGGSDALLIMGFAMIWSLNGIESWSLFDMQITLGSTYSIIAFIFILIAAFAKAGGFPFHTWVPDFSKDAPIESAALLPASLDKLLGIYLLTLMMTTLFAFPVMINMIVMTLGALTIIIAVMMAMVQHNGSKLLGYHAVSQVGYMILGIGSGTVLAFAGGLFHLINHTIYKSNLFLTLGSVEKQTKTTELDYLGGLAKNMPITFIMALIGALSISGIPPFNGFFSKWMIYQGILEKMGTLTSGYQVWILCCLILAIFGSALTLASFMKFLHAVYLGRRPEIYRTVKEAPVNQWLATGILSILCVVFGIFAMELPLGQFIYPVVNNFQMDSPVYLGLYAPQIITILFLIGFILGIGAYLLVRKVRYDDIYLGGSMPLEKFRVAGTEFYNEIKNMSPLKQIYHLAEKKYLDIYDLGSKGTFAISRVFKKAHVGQLQLYLLYILLGTLIFLLII